MAAVPPNNLIMRKSSPESALERKPAGQAADSLGRLRGNLTPIQFRQVVEKLESEDASEAKIAEQVGVPIGKVRRIRARMIGMPKHQMSAIIAASSQLHANVRSMSMDIFQGIYEEIREGAA